MLIREAIVEIVLKTGFIFVPLFLLGIAGWFLVVTILFFLVKERLKKAPSAVNFRKSLLGDEPVPTASKKPSLYHRFIATLYRNRGESEKTTLALYNENMTKSLSPYFLRLGSIQVLAAVAPLLGLLGTVNGMISTFKVISNFGNSNAALLAEGISEALLTTQAGLTIAFPLLLMHIFLKIRLLRVKRKIDSYYNTFREVLY